MASNTNNLTSITDINGTGPVDIIATIKSRSKKTSFGSSSSKKGTKITGILVDNSDSIDFIAWTESAIALDNILKEKNTYKFSNANVAMNKDNFKKTQHGYQIVLGLDTIVELQDIPELIPPINTINLIELAGKTVNQKVTVVGKVFAISAREKLGNTETDIIKTTIADQTASIQYSLIGKEADKCDFSVNDVLLLENVEMRIYGQMKCLQGNTGQRTVNPTQYNFSGKLPSTNAAASKLVNLSPPKTAPQMKTPQNLNRADGRQVVTTSITKIDIRNGIYDKCPKVQCRTSMIYMENGNFYKCNKCGTDYLLASKGIRLVLDISHSNTKKVVVMFNDMAEQLIGLTATEITTCDDEKIRQIEKTIMNRQYTLTVNPGRNDNDVEFLCESFQCEDIQKPKEDNHSLPKPSEVSHNVHRPKEVAHIPHEDDHCHRPQRPQEVDLNQTVKLSSCDVDKPLDLSKPDSSLTGNFQIKSDYLDTEESPISQDNNDDNDDHTCTTPLDLTTKRRIVEEAPRTFKFVRRLDFDTE